MSSFLTNRFCALLAIAATAVAVAGCGSSGDGDEQSGSALAGKAACVPEAGRSMVCGTVFAADGVTPIANAEVRLADGSKGLTTKGVEDPDRCIADARGEFACILPAGTSGTVEFVVIATGFDDQSFMADVVAGSASDAGRVSLTASSEQKWVVVPGAFDGVQVLLSQLKGCTLTNAGGDPAFASASEECTEKGLLVLTEFDPESETEVSNFLTSGSLADYDSLFINCPADWSWSAGVNEAIQAFLNDGGHVYFSDLSASWLDSAFPGYITFGGDFTFAGPPNISGQVVDADLAGVVGTPIDIVFDLAGWIVIDGVEPNVTTYIEGDVTPLSPQVTGVRPLTVGSRPGSSSGCIFYTSYHIEGASTGAPQELAIKYLVQNITTVCQ